MYSSRPQQKPWPDFMISFPVPKCCNFGCSAVISLSPLAGQTGRRRAAWLLAAVCPCQGGVHASMPSPAPPVAPPAYLPTPAAAVTAHFWYSYKQRPSRTPLPAPALPAPRCCACCPPRCAAPCWDAAMALVERPQSMLAATGCAAEHPDDDHLPSPTAVCR